MTMRATLPLKPEPIATCRRWLNRDGYYICDRCGSMWSQLLHGIGWAPLACPERQRNDGEEPSR